MEGLKFLLMGIVSTALFLTGVSDRFRWVLIIAGIALGIYTYVFL